MPTTIIDLSRLTPLGSYLREKVRLIDSGYRPGCVCPWAWLQMTFTALRRRCGSCGGKGMLTEPFHRSQKVPPDLISVVGAALLTCPYCGACEVP